MSAERIRVAFDHRIFAVQAYGGISRYFAGIVPQLGQHGVEARVVAPLHHNAYLPDLPPALVRGLRIPSLRGSRRLALRVNALAGPLLTRPLRPHIVHETYFGARREAPPAARIVLTVYDMIHELFPDQLDDPQTRALKAAAIARADRIHCISRSTRRDLLRFYPEAEERSEVIHLACDPGFAAAAAEREGGAATERPFILHVGPREAYKNFAALLHAYAASPRIVRDFDLVCAGGSPFAPAEQQAIAALGLAGRVRQFPADDAVLRRCYARASLFVYPSLYEGFGIPILEAMASGCPVVAVNVSSVPEVCGDAALLVEQGSAEALREGIERVLDDPARARAMIGAGRRQAAAFSWQRTAARTAASYRALI